MCTPNAKHRTVHAADGFSKETPSSPDSHRTAFITTLFSLNIDIFTRIHTKTSHTELSGRPTRTYPSSLFLFIRLFFSEVNISIKFLWDFSPLITFPIYLFIFLIYFVNDSEFFLLSLLLFFFSFFCSVIFHHP